MQTHPNALSRQTYKYFLQFKDGDEAGLTHIYNHFYEPLSKHGCRIVPDKYVVDTAIQEAFLKAWQLRQRINSPLHTYRFLRLNVTWKCYAYYRQPDRLQRRIIYTDEIDKFSNFFCLQEREDAEQAFALSEEMLKTVYDVIPYLPANQITIFTLYFKYGLSYKQIAKRFASSSQAVSHELQLGLEYLKKIIHNKKRLDSTPRAATSKEQCYPDCLQGEQLQLFRLRYENKWSFEAIASQMNLSVGYVQQQYIAAHRLLKQINNSK